MSNSAVPSAPDKNEKRFVAGMKVVKAGILGKNGTGVREWFQDPDGRWVTRLAKPPMEIESPAEPETM